MTIQLIRTALAPLVFALASAGLQAQTRDEALLARATAAQAATVQTLERLVNIESGSTNLDGIRALSQFLESELVAMGAKVTRHTSTIQGGADNIAGRIEGTGTKHFLMMAHMDTVYPVGTLAKAPFRIDGNRAFGPGIADDKGGIAVILHSIRLLLERGSKDFASITVMFNSDEEVGSRGSSALIQALARDSDYVFSYEPTTALKEMMVMGTSGTAIVTAKVKGRAAHAGANPEAGVNALTEAADLILRTQDLDDKARGLRFNWTIAKSGTVRNVIPDEATIDADLRFMRNEDMDSTLSKLKERAAQTRLPEAKVEISATVGRPAFVAGDQGKRLIDKANAIYKTLGHEIVVVPLTGGGTDAGFAALSGKPVIEGMGLPGFGYHSNQAEYVMVDAIPRRLYLSAQMVIELNKGE
ncbi:MAG: M20/M25/M40 family metallo-hydrolase [Burkholderiales bacterium]|nr:M20/M25/M40 family metallo-hydrolase [Burkholderiales bacterium]